MTRPPSEDAMAKAREFVEGIPGASEYGDSWHGNRTKELAAIIDAERAAARRETIEEAANICDAEAAIRNERYFKAKRGQPARLVEAEAGQTCRDLSIRIRALAARDPKGGA